MAYVVHYTSKVHHISVKLRDAIINVYEKFGKRMTLIVMYFIENIK